MPKYNREVAQADAEDARKRGEGGGNKYINLKDGEDVTGRFLPVERVGDDADSQLYLKYARHRMAGNVYHTCLNQPVVSDYLPAEWGKVPCAFCARFAALKASRDPDEQELAGEFSPKIRFASNFKVTKGDVVIFAYTVKTQPKVVDLAFGGTWGGILDLEDGNDVRIIRKGTELATDYLIEPQPKAYTIPDDVLDDLHDLYADIRILDPKKQALVLKGGTVADADYVTLRELKDAKDGVKPKTEKASGSGAKPSTGKAAVSSSTATDNRMPTPREYKKLNAFLEEIAGPEFELDPDNTYAECVTRLVTEAVGTKTKGLSDDFKAFLELNGCDADGPKVAKAAAVKEVEPEGSSGELSEVERQIAELRKRKAAKK